MLFAVLPLTDVLRPESKVAYDLVDSSSRQRKSAPYAHMYSWDSADADGVLESCTSLSLSGNLDARKAWTCRWSHTKKGGSNAK